MTRLIDADALRDALQYEIDKVTPPFDDTVGAVRCGIRLARNIAEDQPTVDAHVWNPVAEKKPKPYEHVLVTVKGVSRNFTETALYVTNLEKWDKNQYKGEHRSAWIAWDDDWHNYYELSDVIAWMPNIEPYEEKEHEVD